MRKNDGRGGRPHMHDRAYVDAIEAIECGVFPTRYRDLVHYLGRYCSTAIRARLLAAFEWGLITYDAAEDVYQELRRTIGRHWRCRRLSEGRDWQLVM